MSKPCEEVVVSSELLTDLLKAEFEIRTTTSSENERIDVCDSRTSPDHSGYQNEPDNPYHHIYIQKWNRRGEENESVVNNTQKRKQIWEKWF